MKILYILKKEPSESVRKIIEAQSSGNEVGVLKLSKGMDYKKLVEDIFSFDRVICW